MITIKSEREIVLMRTVGKLAAKCLREMGALVKEGVKPSEIDRACIEWTKAHGAIPAPLNYKGFPSSLCVSVNDVVCHGIPDDRPFKKGETVIMEGSGGAAFFLIDSGEAMVSSKGAPAGSREAVARSPGRLVWWQ